jgi:hypothetical protein
MLVREWYGMFSLQLVEIMVGAAGIEPATVGLEIRCSIRLSYAPILTNVAQSKAVSAYRSARLLEATIFYTQAPLYSLKKKRKLKLVF